MYRKTFVEVNIDFSVGGIWNYAAHNIEPSIIRSLVLCYTDSLYGLMLQDHILRQRYWLEKVLGFH